MNTDLEISLSLSFSLSLRLFFHVSFSCFWLILYVCMQHCLSAPSFPPGSSYLDRHGNTHTHIPMRTLRRACSKSFLITPDLLTCNDTAATLISQSAYGATQVLSGSAIGLIKPSDRPLLMHFLFWYASSFFIFSTSWSPHSLGEGAGALPGCLCCMCK